MFGLRESSEETWIHGNPPLAKDKIQSPPLPRPRTEACREKYLLAFDQVSWGSIPQLCRVN